MLKEKANPGWNGYKAIPILFCIQILGLVPLITAVVDLINGETPYPSMVFWLFTVFMAGAPCVLWLGFFNVNPNQAKVMQLFGNYVGSAKVPGLRWANPLYRKKEVSLRTRNFETNTIKVNDKDGNPIEISAVVVWSIVDSAEAVFEVNNCEDFVGIQSESALRNLAARYAYDMHDDQEISLRSRGSEVVSALRSEIQKRLTQAGVEVHEAQITHLAYAPEIAQAMLQRQQAGAIIAARTQIVEGAVSMVEMALQRIDEQGIVEFDDEKKAAMVSNLLVVLCGDSNATPIINTGTIYS